MVKWIGSYQPWVRKFQTTLWWSRYYDLDMDFANAIDDVQQELKRSTRLEF